MQTPYWEFFLAIEDELAQTTRYVDFNDDHLRQVILPLVPL
jgi:hypothetical protein